MRDRAVFRWPRLKVTCIREGEGGFTKLPQPHDTAAALRVPLDLQKRSAWGCLGNADGMSYALGRTMLPPPPCTHHAPLPPAPTMLAPPSKVAMRRNGSSTASGCHSTMKAEGPAAWRTAATARCTAAAGPCMTPATAAALATSTMPAATEATPTRGEDAAAAASASRRPCSGTPPDSAAAAPPPLPPPLTASSSA